MKKSTTLSLSIVITLFLCICLSLVTGQGQGRGGPKPKPSPSPSPTPTATPTPSPTPTATPTPNPTPIPDTTAPTSSITAPLNGAVLSGTVSVAVTASDNVAVDSVYLIVDGSVLGGTSTAPYSFSLNTSQLSNGAHSMFARAWDSAGNPGDSPVVSFTVSNGEPTPTPTPEPSPTPTATPTPSPTPTPTPSPTPGTAFTIITANLAHGQGTDNQFRAPYETVPAADVIIGQEVATGDVPSWNNGFAAQGMTFAGYAKHPNSSGAGDGNAIWYNASTVTFHGAYPHDLSNGFIGWDGTTVDRAVIALDFTAYGRRMVLVNTHLCHSRCSDSQGSLFSTQREAQINELLSWVNATFPSSIKIIAGDYNLTAAFLKHSGGFQIDLFLQDYVELWSFGLSTGTAIANWGDRDADGLPDMPLDKPRTADRRQIDYFMLSKNSSLVVGSIELLDLRAQCPHALVPGGAFPSCSPEVVGGPEISGKQWDTQDDYGVRPSDHNFLRLTLLL